MVALSTTTLLTTPESGIRALKQAAAGRPHWRIRTGGAGDAARFVIEKQVRYQLVRGWPMTATYTIMGSFQQTVNGETTLRYAVSGQPWIPAFQATFFITLLAIFTLFLGGLVFSPMMVNQWIGVLLLGVMVVIILAYGWFAYRSYQGHLKELRDFMETFAQAAAISSEILP
jgi:hypothetical protein